MKRMNMIKKKILGLLFGVGILALSGCGESPITDENSKEIAIDNFKVSVYDTYEPDENEEMFFTSKELKTVAVLEMANVHCTMDAYERMYREEFLCDSYGIEESDIQADAVDLNNQSECRKLSYQYKEEEKSYYGESYLIMCEGNVLIMAGASLKANKSEFQFEMKEMANTVEYIGEYHLPETYPYTEKIDDMEITIRKGFVSKSTDNYVQINYRAADTSEKGDVAHFSIQKEHNTEYSAEEAANARFEKMKSENNFQNGELQTMTFSEITDGIDAKFSDIIVYGIHTEYTGFSFVENIVNWDFYYFDYDGKTYIIQIRYIDGDDAMKEDMTKQLLNLKLSESER